MPNYYNPYMNAYPINYSNGSFYPLQNVQQQAQPVPQVQQPSYMITVDGENAAKAWQPTTPPQPNTIIPLFDSDGQHVYFKTFDAYGRMNPVRKGTILFEDEIRMSEAKAPEQVHEDYATSADIRRLDQEVSDLKAMFQKQNNSNNQNGTNNRGERR